MDTCIRIHVYTFNLMGPENPVCIEGFTCPMFHRQEAKFQKAFDVFQNDVMFYQKPRYTDILKSFFFDILVYALPK